jgi:hypothetical protein
MTEVWELEVNGSWTVSSWYYARSWSGRVRLNGQPWYGPSCLLHTGLPQPYVHD